MGLFDRLLGRTPEPDRPEVGASGTVNLNGFLVAHEYNWNLAGKAGLRVWSEMHRSDAAIRETLWHIFAPILNANWTVEPPDDPDVDELFAAELVRVAFFEELDQPFSEYLRQVLLYLRDGVQLFEPLWKVVEGVELKVEMPPAPGAPAASAQTQTRTLDQVLTWKKFAQRLPSTVWRWNTTDGDLDSIEQQVFKDGEWDTITIYAEDLLVLVNEREGDDFNGLSLLRSAYKPWFYKDLFEKIALKAYETHGVGINVAYLPSAAAHDKTQVQVVEDMLARIRAGEDTNLVFPGPKAQASAQAGDGYTFNIETPSGGIPDFKPMLEYFRGEIKGNALVRFAELGHGQSGARATGNTQSEVWYDALHAVATHIAECHRQVIERLVRSNLENVKRMPRLVPQDIEARNLTDFATAVSALVSSGALEPDRVARAAIRQGVDFPPEEDPDAIDEQRAGPPAPPDPYPPPGDTGKPAPKPPAPEPGPPDPAPRAADLFALASLLGNFKTPAPDAPQVDVHVHPPDVDVDVHLPPVQTDVHVAQPPAPPAPDVHVDYTAPDVHVDVHPGDTHVDTPEQPKRSFRFTRDDDGKADGIEEV
jgi:hypothetical protein